MSSEHVVNLQRAKQLKPVGDCAGCLESAVYDLRWMRQARPCQVMAHELCRKLEKYGPGSSYPRSSAHGNAVVCVWKSRAFRERLFPVLRSATVFLDKLTIFLLVRRPSSDQPARATGLTWSRLTASKRSCATAFILHCGHVLRGTARGG